LLHFVRNDKCRHRKALALRDFALLYEKAVAVQNGI